MNSQIIATKICLLVSMFSVHARTILLGISLWPHPKHPSHWKDNHISNIFYSYFALKVYYFVHYLFIVAVIGTLLSLFVDSLPDGNEIVFACSIVGSILGELVCFHFAEDIIHKCGYINCIYIACVAFSIRLVQSAFLCM